MAGPTWYAPAMIGLPRRPSSIARRLSTGRRSTARCNPLTRLRLSRSPAPRIPSRRIDRSLPRCAAARASNRSYPRPVPTTQRPPWTRIAIAAPGVAAAIVALVGLIGGPHSGRHGHTASHPAGHRAARPPGPAPLVAGPPQAVPVPRHLVGHGPFLTVAGSAARLGPAPR